MNKLSNEEVLFRLKLTLQSVETTSDRKEVLEEWFQHIRWISTKMGVSSPLIKRAIRKFCRQLLKEDPALLSNLGI